MFGRTQQHGRMSIMAASMHLACLVRLISQPCGFLDWQCIHISAQANTPVATTLAVHQPNNPGITNPSVDLINAKIPQPFCHNLTGVMFFEPDLRMGVQAFKNISQVIFGCSNYW